MERISEAEPHPMKLKVETAGIADWVTLIIPAPECRRGRFTVGASHALTTTRALIQVTKSISIIEPQIGSNHANL